MLRYEHYNPQEDQYESLEVFYKITGGCLSKMTGHPDTWHGPEEPEIDMIIYNRSGLEVSSELDAETLRLIEDKCWEEYHSRKLNY